MGKGGVWRKLKIEVKIKIKRGKKVVCQITVG
jgi:hypothetical protein